MSAGGIPPLYRIIKGEVAEERDFHSAMVLARKPPRPEERERPEEWTGLSMFDDAAEARRRIRRWPVMGKALALVEDIDPEWSIVKQTIHPGHYTAWGRPEIFLASVKGIIPARGDH